VFLPRMTTRALRWVTAFLLALGAATVITATVLSFYRSQADHRYSEAVETLKRQAIAAGYHADMPLGDRFRSLSWNGTVDVVRTLDGRLIVLFKTSIGWKGNYRGRICTDAPLKADEVGTDPYGRRAIFVRPISSVIEKRIDDRCYAVYFDLG
jgi:hypothetical protein